MKCAICGKDNQAGTRFCVHCGAALAAAPAGAVLTTGVSSVTRPGASPAPPVPPSRPAPPPPPEAATAPRPVAPAPSVPAYDVAPKKSSVVLLLLGLTALVAVGGFIGYKVFGVPTEVRDTLTRGEAPPVTPPATAPTTAPAPSIATPNVPVETAKPADDKTTAPSASTAAPPAGAPEAGKAPADTAPKVEVKPAQKSPAASASKEARPPTSTPTTQPPTSSPAPVPRAASAANAAPEAAPPAQDRWSQMSEELRGCQRESFLARVVCDQRVRLRFCDGYWGKVSQCPGNVVNPDRGQ